MARKSVAPQPRQPNPQAAKPPQGRTLADVTVTHTIGTRTTTVPGLELAQRIDATRHLHDPDGSSDFIDPISIAIELGGVADVLTALTGDYAKPCALGYLSDQLRRLSNRVAVLAPRSVNQQPDWYKVEVTK